MNLQDSTSALLKIEPEISEGDGIRANVATLLERFGVKFSALYIAHRRKPGQGINGKPWECFEWSLILTKSDSREHLGEFPYFCGMGHITEPKAAELRKLKTDFGPHRYKLTDEYKRACKPKAPVAADLIYSVAMDASACNQTFEDWCGDLGYDTDSRKAFETYVACQNQCNQLRRLFNDKQISELFEAVEGY